MKCQICILYLHLIHKVAETELLQDMFEIEATTDAKIRDDWSEDLGAVDQPSLPPALPHHVRGLCREVWGVARQGWLPEQTEQIGIGASKFILESDV